MSAAVLGAGGWGTTLALLLARRGHTVRLWARRPELARELDTRRENRVYLPGHPLPAGIVVTSSLAEALAGIELVVVAVPSQHLRAALAGAAPFVPRESIRLSATKGIERSTLLRMSEVVTEIWGPGVVVALSGPSFAAEVARGEPTAVTAASAHAGAAQRAQEVLSSETFRVYSSDDIIGVELGGALKNVIAIAAGMVRGLGFGANALAALLTRGLAEMSRLGVAMGASRDTFIGLSGMGDLLLTSTGALSRNARLGEAVARGERGLGARTPSGMIAEGMDTALSAAALAERAEVDLPITREVVAVLHGGKDAREAVRDLMLRALKSE